MSNFRAACRTLESSFDVRINISVRRVIRIGYGNKDASVEQRHNRVSPSKHREDLEYHRKTPQIPAHIITTLVQPTP